MRNALLLLALMHYPLPAASVDSAQLGLELLAVKLHQSLINRQALLEDRPLVAHCETLLDRLFPDHAGAFSVYISLDHKPMPLAFALPGNRIYLSAGLFLLIQTDVELAFVLAHEAIHLLNRHTHRRLSAASISKRDPISGDFLAEFELQADRVAVERLRGVGLDFSGIGDFLQRLGRVHEQSGNISKRLELRKRINQLRALVDDSVVDKALMDKALMGKALMDKRVDGSSNVAVLTAPIRARVLQRLLDLGQWQSVLDCMISGCSVALPGVVRERLWADALRISGLPEYGGLAIEKYQAALALDDEDWQAWLGLALIQDRLQSCRAAQTAWRNVVRLAPAGAVGIAVWRSRLERFACGD